MELIKEIEDIILQLCYVRGLSDNPNIGSRITEVTKELNDIIKDIEI